MYSAASGLLPSLPHFNSSCLQAGGRLALVELPALIGVDLVHCERQGAALVAESDGAVMEAQGELITTQYFDSIAAEINDLLQVRETGALCWLVVQRCLCSCEPTCMHLLGVVDSCAGSYFSSLGRRRGMCCWAPSAPRQPPSAPSHTICHASQQQESGQVSVADLAVQYALNTELIMSTISQRVGSLIMVRGSEAKEWWMKAWFMVPCLHP